MVIVFVIFVILGFLLFVWMFIEAHQNNIVNYTIESLDYPDNVEPFTLFFISDIHRRSVSRKLLEKVKGHQVHAIVIGGDIVEIGVPITRVHNNLKKLKEIAPVFFIWGNHDHQYGKQVLEEALLHSNVCILDNDSFKLFPNVFLVGVDDSTHDHDDLDKAFRHCPPTSFCILLSHNPNIREKLNRAHSVPLILSGHTHGGQIRLFGWGLRELGGIKDLENGKLIISNGYGTTRYPLRLGAPPDTMLVTIKNKNE